MLSVLLEGQLGETQEMNVRSIKLFEPENSLASAFSGHAAEHEGTMGLAALSA
jgi:hypothetical protein